MRPFHLKSSFPVLVAILAAVSTVTLAQTCYFGETHGGSSYVNVLDLTTLTVVAQIPVAQPSGAIAFSSDGSWAYVTSFGGLDGSGNEVLGIDTALEEVVDAYGPVCGIGQSPLFLSITPDDRYVVVSCWNRVILSPGNMIVRIDTADGRIRRTQFDFRVGPLAIRPVFGDKIYIVEPSTPLSPRNALVVIDVDTWQVISSLVVGSGVTLPRFCSDGAFAYVGGFGRLIRIDAQIDAIVSEVTLPGSPPQPVTGLVLNSDCSRAYMAHGNRLTGIDTLTGRIIASTQTSLPLYELAITADDSYLLASTLGSEGRLLVIDAKSLEILAQLEVGATAIACSPV